MSEYDCKIREVVYNDDNIVDVIRNAPQSFNSILKSSRDNKTMLFVLKRRMKRLINQGRVWKMRVPGTRFGLVLFCTPEHDYKILVQQKIVGVNIFYMHEFCEDNDFLVLNNYWKLEDDWSKWVYYDVPNKIPKYTLRDGGFRLWE